MLLKFIADAYYNGVHVHKVGETKEVDNKLGEANRWLARGVAIEVFAGKAEEVKPAPVIVEEPPKVEEVKVEDPKLEDHPPVVEEQVQLQEESFLEPKKSKKGKK